MVDCNIPTFLPTKLILPLYRTLFAVKKTEVWQDRRALHYVKSHMHLRHALRQNYIGINYKHIYMLVHLPRTII